MKSIGENLFRLNRTLGPVSDGSFKRVTAKSLGLQESWFRDAIFSEPELVIGPCRAAARIDADEVWIPWRIEANFGAGPIDVLLVSSHGRLGIVETKLSYNPQKRREVVAQVLDYALSLQVTDRDDLPELPESPHAPLEEDLVECLDTSRFLLVIAGDSLDPRALRLSNSMLARHLTSEWDLAMVDLNVYQDDQNPDQLIVVPELLRAVQSDLRQVVRVVVEGSSPKARIVVDKKIHDDERPGRSPVAATSEEFLGEVETQVPAHRAAAEQIIGCMKQISCRSKGILTFGLRETSANLYFASPSGPRRFISLRTDGRFRVVLAYLRTAGLESVIDAVVEAVRPLIKLDRDDRASGVRFSTQNQEAILELLQKLELSLVDRKADK
jgi:hypothetical protein